MGSTVQRGESEAVAEATGSNTVLGRTASLLQTGTSRRISYLTALRQTSPKIYDSKYTNSGCPYFPPAAIND